jgi:hypothetical protein
MKNQYNKTVLEKTGSLSTSRICKKNYAGLHWRMCQNQQRNYDLQMWFGYENGSFNTEFM